MGGREYFQRLRLVEIHAIDDGVVVQYNEDRNRYWSMYRPATLSGFLAVGRGWWVSVLPYDQQGATKW